MSGDRLLYDWFGDSVGPHAERTALEVGSDVLSYAELARLAAVLAGRLLAATGTGEPPRRVGLLTSRSVTGYAGYLAVLRLGATPVPLNPAFPVARNRAIGQAAQLDLVVRDDSGAGIDVGVPSLDVPAGALPALAAEAEPALPSSAATADDYCYILFTSGSTGTPKGVPLTHRNIDAFVAHIRQRYPAGPGARLSQVAELTFDPSVHDMFVAWSTGAALVVPSREEILAPAEFINRKRLTHWFSVPSVISAAARLGELAPGCLPTLRMSLFSGEPLTVQQAQRWQAAAPHSVLDNIYGPTELTGCFEYRLPAEPADWPDTENGTVPIGFPYPGMEIAVLGEDGLPAGTGELVMRGVQRFPGYLDPAQNSGRFVVFDGTPARPYTDPAPPPPEVWYATGDLVTRQGNAWLHLGRRDHQVKVRGHRVEVGEVEAALRAQHGVRDAVVLARPDADGEVQLRAACTGSGVSSPAVLTALAERLPGPMLPRSLIVFDELPLNANGKIDRSILAEVLFSD